MTSAGFTFDPWGKEEPREQPEPDSPTPLKPQRAPAAFPFDALPPWAADYVAALAEATQTPTDAAAVCALGGFSACAGGRAVVEARQGWREQLNMYLLLVMPPGSRKSAVVSATARPLYDFERARVTDVAGLIAEAKITKDIAEKAAEKARSMAAQAGASDEAMAEAIGASAFAAEIIVPTVPRLLVDDVTPEAVASLLAEQGGRLAVVSAEGGIFDILAGRYSNGVPQLDVWLKGHSGDPLRVDRKGRPAEHIDAPALTVLLTVQPQVLAQIARNGAFRGRGLLARFLYAIPASNIGRRRIGASPVPEEVSNRYAERVTRLAEAMAGWNDPAVLTLAPDAHNLLLDVERWVEAQLAPDGTLSAIPEWGSKLAGAILRIAGLLHLADGAPDAIRHPISADTLTQAVRIGGYFSEHARAAFNILGDEETADAAYVLQHLQRKQIKTFTIRDLHVELSRSRFPKVEIVQKAVDILEDHRWVTPLSAPPREGRPGRPPSPAYDVHPDLHATQTTQHTQPSQSESFVDSVVSVVPSPNGERTYP